MRQLARTVHLLGDDGVPVVYLAGTPHSAVPGGHRGDLAGGHLWRDAAGGEEPLPAQTPAPAPTAAPAAEEPRPALGDVEPPAGNASTDEWRTYAAAVGLPVTEDMGRDMIREQLRDRGLLE